MDLSASGRASALTCILNGLTLRSLGELSKGHPLAKERFNGPFVQSRDVSVLLSGRRCAGVYFGLDSESGITNPSTHPPNGAVGFSFFCEVFDVFFTITVNYFLGRRWRRGKRAGLQNLYSRVQFPPGAPSFKSNRQVSGRLQMSNRTDTPRKASLLDVYAVALALALALLVRFNLLPAIKW